MYKRGVYFHKKAGKWTAQIKVFDKKIHLGLFDCFEKAVNARLKAEIEYSYKEINIYKSVITQEELKEVLDYDPSTGVFLWKVNFGGHVVKGREAGSIDYDPRPGGKTYRRIQVYKKMYMAHRLVFLYMSGFLPEFTDHVNGDGLDNRWNNLRIVSITENNKNARIQTNNKSGIMGVSFHKQTRKWQANINNLGKAIYLGLFSDFFEACCARKSAENKYGFHPNHNTTRML